jgi:hypothetical protein
VSKPLDITAPLTARQTEILGAAQSYREAHGRWPSRTELGVVLGADGNGYVQRVLVKLRAIGAMPQTRRAAHCDWWAQVREEIVTAAAAAGIDVSEQLLGIIHIAVEGDRH